MCKTNHWSEFSNISLACPNIFQPRGGRARSSWILMVLSVRDCSFSGLFCCKETKEDYQIDKYGHCWKSPHWLFTFDLIYLMCLSFQFSRVGQNKIVPEDIPQCFISRPKYFLIRKFRGEHIDCTAGAEQRTKLARHSALSVREG